MTDVLTSFFADGTRVTAVPRRDDPRLVVAGAGVGERWRNSSLFPGHSRRGRLYRAAMRSLTATGLLQRRVGCEIGQLSLVRFLNGELPGATAASVLVGTAGPTQMITVELRNPDGRIAGYGKYAELPKAITRLLVEADTLRQLPPGIAPLVLRFGDWENGKLLLTTPVVGRKVGPTLPPAPAVEEYLDQLPRGGSYAIREHPMIRRLVEHTPRCAAWLDPLEGSWPTVVQHGDFAPWNLRHAEHGVVAFDWEYANTEGFPGFDLAYYWMQTQSLVESRRSERALEAAAGAVSSYLRESPAAGRAVVKLAMLDAFLVGREDGHPDDFPNQAWRLELLGDAFA